MGTSRLLLFVLVIACFFSCDKKGVFDTYKTLDKAEWNRKAPVSFQFSINDTLKKHHLFFMLRNNQDYAFSNLFLIADLQFPNGKKIVDTLEYLMADSRGRFLGKGLSTNKENKMYYKENIIFPLSGTYTLNLSHAMRKSGAVEGLTELKGITEIGLRIEKAN